MLQYRQQRQGALRRPGPLAPGDGPGVSPQGSRRGWRLLPHGSGPPAPWLRAPGPRPQGGGPCLVGGFPYSPWGVPGSLTPVPLPLLEPLGPPGLQELSEKSPGFWELRVLSGLREVSGKGGRHSGNGWGPPVSGWPPLRPKDARYGGWDDSSPVRWGDPPAGSHLVRQGRWGRGENRGASWGSGKEEDGNGQVVFQNVGKE